MTYEEMVRVYEKDKFESSEESKKRKEEEKKKKEERDRRNEEIRQIVIEEDNQRRRKAEMEKFQKKLEEEDERMRLEMEKVSDMEKDIEQLKEFIVEKPEVMEHTELNLNRIKDWSIVDLKVGVLSERIKIEREDGAVYLYKSFEDVCRKCTILDMEDLYGVCLIKEAEGKLISSEKIIWEQIMMMFEPRRFRHLFQSRKFVRSWKLFGYSGAHEVIFQEGEKLFMLITKRYDLSLPLCREMLKVKLSAAKTSEEALNLIYMVANQKFKREKLTKK